MIHRCRPDFDLRTCYQLLAGLLAKGSGNLSGLEYLAHRRLLHTPSAREGLRWFLKASGVGAGTEVAVPALICEAVAEAIVGAGARPVVFGIDPVDLSPSLASCQAAVGPTTKAVVLPHLYGIPADLAGFSKLCKERKLLLIEIGRAHV